MSSLSPEDLARWCRRTLPEDTRAFETLVARYQGKVFTIAYRMLGDRQEAEDQTQEIFWKIYRGIQSLDEPATLPAWINRIAVNTCLDALERRRRRPQFAILDPPEGRDEPPEYADPRQSPEDAALQREERGCLERTLAGLDPSVRAVIVLRDIEDWPYQEIADRLAIGLSAVKMRIQRARRSFQDLLARVCPDLIGRRSA